MHCIIFYSLARRAALTGKIWSSMHTLWSLSLIRWMFVVFIHHEASVWPFHCWMESHFALQALHQVHVLSKNIFKMHLLYWEFTNVQASWSHSLLIQTGEKSRRLCCQVRLQGTDLISLPMYSTSKLLICWMASWWKKYSVGLLHMFTLFVTDAA